MLDSKKSKILKITSLKILAIKLHTTEKELENICADIRTFDEKDNQKYVFQKTRNDKNGKSRNTKTPVGRFRAINDGLQTLLQKLDFPIYVMGGLKGGDNIKNAEPHIGKPLLVRIDLKSFFPNISQRRVYRMFLEQQGCSEPVATILTRLTTFKGKLPEG